MKHCWIFCKENSKGRKKKKFFSLWKLFLPLFRSFIQTKEYNSFEAHTEALNARNRSEENSTLVAGFKYL